MAGKKNRKRSGQVMILTVLALGGTILGAATVASLLVVYQIRQSTDLANSARAIFAADTGIEWGLYNSITGQVASLPIFTNGASVNVNCYDALAAQLPDCNSTSTALIKSLGKSGSATRAFGLTL